MTTPRKAVLLAAGFGSRMRPLNLDLPKPLMPRGQAPHIGHMLELIASWGVTDALINLHHNPNPLFNYLTHTYAGPLRIQLSFEPEILGTGGALQKAHWFLDDKPFWMINTDILADLDPTPLIKAQKKPGVSAALWVTADNGPRTVAVSSNGCITDFRSPNAGNPGTYTFCGLQLLDPKLLSHLPETGFSSIIRAYEQSLKEAPESILGVTCEGSCWADLGTPKRYLDSVTLYVDRNQISTLAKVHPRAQVMASAIWDGAKLGARARVFNTIIGRNVQINCATDAPTVTLSCIPYGPAHAAAEHLGWDPARCACSALPARGSDRSFSRIIFGAASVIVIQYGDQRPENNHYAALATRLRKAGLPVPQVLYHNHRSGLLILEDFGCTDLLQAISGISQTARFHTYVRVLDLLRTLQAMPVSAIPRRLLQPCFDTALYQWEHDLFLSHMCHDRLGLSRSRQQLLQRELTSLANALLSYPHRSLVHRDLQSTNILIQKRAPHFIDFQGLRRGCPTYDAASLICDPYVMLSPPLQERLIARYLTSSPASIDRHAFDLAAVQRLIQALGAFARLASLPDTKRFESHIQPGAEMLCRFLPRLDNCTNLLAFASQLARQ